MVEPQVACQLGVERGRQERALAHQHRVAVDASQDIDVLADRRDPRGADEHARERRPADALDRQRGFERLALAPVVVPPDAYVEEPERLRVAPARARLELPGRGLGRAALGRVAVVP